MNLSELNPDVIDVENGMSSTDSPIFIVGLSRSGTSLLSRMLDAHSSIAIFPETWWCAILDRLGCVRQFKDPWQTSLFFNEVWENLRYYRDPAARIVAAEAAKFPRYVGPTARVLETLGQAYARERHAKMWGEKSPGHALWLPEIWKLFPRARLLFMVRDPRDVVISYDDRWNRGRRDTDFLIEKAALLKFFVIHLLNDPIFPAEQIHWVRYESLTAQPAEKLKEVCGFLGVNFEPSMLSFYEKHQNVEEEMWEGRYHTFLGSPANTEHVGRYNRLLSPAQVALIERFLGTEMERLGYSLSRSYSREFAPDEEEAFHQAQDYYNRMVAGDFRRRLRREGRTKLRAYQVFGRALHVVPSWRVAVTGRDWRSLAEKPEVVSPPAETLIADAARANTAKAEFQSEMGRISRQSGVALAGTIFTAGLGYVFKIYLAHLLGAEALGLYALGMTIISFVGILNVMGLPDAAVRYVALYKASKKFDQLRSLLWNGALLLLASNLIFAALLLKAGPWIATRFYHSPKLGSYFPLFALIMITGALNSFLGKVLAGYKEVGRRTVITRFVASPLTMAAAFLLITLGGRLGGYLVAQVLSAAVVATLLFALMWRLTPSEARLPDLRKLWIPGEVWSYSIAMAGVGLMEFFMSQADRIALGFYRGASDVGVYAVAAALIAYEPIVLQSINQIFAPVIADVHGRGQNALLGRLFQTLTKWMLGLTLPLAMVIIVYSRPIMRIFGHDFEAGWPVLIIGTCGQLINCGVGSVGCLLFMSGNQRRLIRVQVVMALAMVGLSIQLVPLWGVIGAAVAAAVTNAGMNAWNLVEVRRALKLSPYNRSYLKLLPSAGSALLVTLLMHKTARFMGPDWAAIAATLVLAYAVFFVLTFAMGLNADDSLIADAVWARVRRALP